MPTQVFHGWRVVAACFVIAAFAWGLGLFGSSVYLQAVTTTHGWAISEVAPAITLFFLVGASIQRLVGRSIDRLGPRPVMIVGAISMGSGVALIGQTWAPWQLYPCFVLIGIGWAMLSMVAITATVAPWFERHQGRSMTLAITGASIGAILGVPLILLALRQLGLAGGLLTTGMVSVVLLVPLVWRVMRFKGPADIGARRDGDAPVLVDAPAVPVAPRPLAATGRPGMLLWSVAAAIALGLTVQIGFITHHVALAAPLLGAEGAGLLVSATGVTAFAGRLVLAKIVDGVSVRRLAALIMVMQTLALGAMSMWPTVPVTIAASLVYGYGIGHVTTLGPVIVRREFGAEAFGARYGAAATVIQLVSALGPALFGLARDAYGSYGPGLAIAACGTLVGCAVLIVGGRLGSRPAAA